MFDKKAYLKAWKEKNKEHVASYNKAYREANSEYYKNYGKTYFPKYYQDNKQLMDAANKEWNKAHPIRRKQVVSKWDRANQSYRNYIEATRRATKLKATPKWADLEAIRSFYENCPAGYHVDHIIPLKGKNVTGLHVLNNLQYLPAIENIKKGNKV